MTYFFCYEVTAGTQQRNTPANNMDEKHDLRQNSTDRIPSIE